MEKRKKYEDLLKELRKAYNKKLEPGPECPLDEVLFDYVYDDATEAERKEVSEHIKTCERCSIQVMKFKADRFEWEYALDVDPYAAFAGTIGPYATQHEPKMEHRIRSLWEYYQKLVKEGLERFQGALEALQQWISDGNAPILLPTTVRGKREGLRRGTYCLGDEPPIYPFSVPSESRYHTLVMLRLSRENVVVLYENWEVTRPFQVSPQFEEEDLGTNLLYLFLTTERLDISHNEAEITPDRLIEIISQLDKERSRIIIFEVEVKKEG